MTIRMRATFTGSDGSLGYRTGQTYDLLLQEKGLFRKAPAIVFPHPCPYGSWEAFHRNWTAEN